MPTAPGNAIAHAAATAFVVIARHLLAGMRDPRGATAARIAFMTDLPKFRSLLVPGIFCGTNDDVGPTGRYGASKPQDFAGGSAVTATCPELPNRVAANRP